MNKAQLVKSIAEKVDMPKKTIERIFDGLSSVLNENVKTEDEIILGMDIGRIIIKETPERKGRNPKTGEYLLVPAKRRVSFKASVNLKKSANEKSE